MKWKKLQGKRGIEGEPVQLACIVIEPNLTARILSSDNKYGVAVGVDCFRQKPSIQFLGPRFEGSVHVRESSSFALRDRDRSDTDVPMQPRDRCVSKPRIVNGLRGDIKRGFDVPDIDSLMREHPVMSKHVLTKEQRLEGLLKALKSDRTPAWLKPSMRRYVANLRREIRRSTRKS
jgi:hypothetical protein